MDKQLWTHLRYWQSSSEHVSHRALLLSLLREPSPCPDVAELRRRARERGFPWPAPSAADPLWRQACLEARQLREAGVHALTPADANYPSCFWRSSDPPLTLSVRGSLEVFHRPALSVVGSREPSVDSLQWLERELAVFCRNTGAVIASGGARGIDQKAHSVALRSSSPTLVFLPSGILRPYPADLEKWWPAVRDGGGALVSEYPPFMPMRKPHFHQRNRLIAAAGCAVLIIEARQRSGTLITAARAAEIGRPLLVLPGHPLDSRFSGSLQLLFDGATLLRDGEDLTILWQSEEERSLLKTLAIEDDNGSFPEM
ncbi:MAG: DNA-protecting protein DprA [Bdellovibrionaceae bacterium]|nr:DNA-protecting protein DprA [Pseudobdellovibrionaceae bacterium]